ncbi:MAG: hypothetical protein IAF94_23650 [Pirellulaceae bacterium]|nr:hypothetical protein [Pirellulaceae bacterium]
MEQDLRENRLRTDLAALEALRAQSTILQFETSEPADRYTITFRGKGLARSAAGSDISIVELHQVDLRLPFSYPQRAPDIRWLTPILHPNISFSGFLNLAEVGLPWSEDLGLDVVCERLWDVARGAYMNLEKSANFSAKNWYEKENQHELPLDRRPLRDRGGSGNTNIVRYQRRGQNLQIPASGTPSEVIFIDENTPVPSIPSRGPIRQRAGDVLYIGPE